MRSTTPPSSPGALAVVREFLARGGDWADTDLVLRSAVELLHEHLDVRVALLRVDPASGSASPLAQAPQGQLPPLSPGALARAIRQDRTQCVSEATEIPGPGGTGCAEALIPVRVGRGTWGLLHLQPADRELDPAELEVAETVAAQLGVALAATGAAYTMPTGSAQGVVEELRHQLAESAALAEVGRAVTGTLSLEDVLSIVVREAEALTGAASASVALVEDDGEHIRVSATRGALIPDQGKVFSLDGSLVGWVIRHAETAVTDNVSDDPRSRPNPIRHGPAAVVPLGARGRILGALLVARAENDPPLQPGDVEALRKLAAYAAIAIENAQLHTRSERLLHRMQSRLDLLSALLDTGNRMRVETDLSVILQEICEAIRSVLGWKLVVLSLRDNRQRTTRAMAAAGYDEETREAILSRPPAPVRGVETLFRDEFRISNSYFVDHTHFDQIRSSSHVISAELRTAGPDGAGWHPEDALIVPVTLRGQLLGLISPDSPADGKKPSLEAVQALELFANQAAVAIDNARLFQAQKETAEALQRRVDLLSALFDTGSRLRLQLDSATLLQEICETIHDALGWEQVVISLRDYEAGTSQPVAVTGYPEPQRREILGITPVPILQATSILREEFRVSNSYLIDHRHAEMVRTNSRLIRGPGEGTGADGDWDPEDVLMVPIELRGQILGFISPDNPRDGRRPSRDAIQALELFANQAAIAIDNARLFQAQKETADALRLKTEELVQAYAELSRSQEQLLVSEKMAALGRVTAGIAHEINSPLGGILNSLQMARSYAEEYRSSAGDAEVMPEDHQAIAGDLIETLTLAEGATRKVAQFVRTIKDQTRAGAEEATRRFDPAAEISATLTVLGHALRSSGIEVRKEVQAGLELQADPGKFALVLQNLLSNAIDAYGGQGGEVCVRLQAEAGGGGGVVLEVEDHGSGIPEEIRGRIFDYLFTTKEVGKGTGLGLSMVHSIVTSHFGGEVQVQSEVGRGSTFRVKIPRAKTTQP